MKLICVFVLCIVTGLAIAPAEADGCYNDEVTLFSKAALGGPIESPERSSRDDCSGDLRRFRGDVLPGATQLSVAEQGHRPKAGAIRVIGSFFDDSFPLEFPSEPDQSGTWRSEWVDVTPFSILMPGDRLIVHLCVEAVSPETTRCFDAYFYA